MEENQSSPFPAKILVGTDTSEDAMIAARAAVKLANETGAELHVVHVGHLQARPPGATATGFPPPVETPEEFRREAQHALDAEVKQIEQAGGTVAAAHLRMGKPAEEILRLSEEIVAGLIVVGNQGIGSRFSRMRRFLMGSVSESVMRYARCSVMVARKDLYDSPTA